MTGEVPQQGTIPNQQQSLAGNQREHKRAEQQAAGENARDREQAAQKHDAKWYLQVRSSGTDQRLEKKRNTRDHQELLQQQQARPDADLRVETLKMDPEEDAKPNQRNTCQPREARKVIRGIHFEEQVGGKDERRKDQQSFK